jgi:uncharacterized membrane protein
MEQLNFLAIQTGITAIIDKSFWYAVIFLSTVILKDWALLTYRSLVIKFSRDFTIGDIIEVDSAIGEIVSISGYKIRLRTKDGYHVILPLSVFFENIVVVRKR